MSAVLEFPKIDPAPAETLPAVAARAVVTVKAAALAEFDAIEPSIRALAARYAKVAFDCAKPAGLKAAKAARAEIREQGRYAVQRARDAIKDQLNDTKSAVVDRAAALIELLQPAEENAAAQILAEEKRQEDARIERERIAAERRKGFEDAIAKIRAYADHAAGMSAARIAVGIARLEAITFGGEWQEFLAAATTAKAETLSKLIVLHEQALEAERLRAENERLLAELAARPAPVTPTEQIAIVAARATVTLPGGDQADASTGEILDPITTHTPEQGAQHVLKAEAEAPDATDRESPAHASPVGGPMGVGQPAAAGPAAAPSEPPLKLGDINARLRVVTLSAAGLAELGISRLEGKGTAVLIAASDWPRLKAALVKHLGAVE